jgi:hypothetical protein
MSVVPSDYSRIQMNLVETWQVARRHLDDAGKYDGAGSRTEYTACEEEQSLFSDELTDEPSPTASDGRTDAELVCARCSSVDQQTRKVDAADEQ